MKFRIFAFLPIFLVLASLVTAYPKLNDFVTDDANVIDENYEAAILGLAKHIEQNTTAEIAVVTVKSLEGESIEIYANELFKQAMIGKKDIDNGLLILVAPTERKFRIEVGYGLEGTLTDAAAMEIGNNILTPNFRNNDYGKGIHDAIVVIAANLEGNQEVLSQYQAVYVNQSTYGSPWFNLIFLAILILSMGFGGMGYGRRRRNGFIPIFIGGYGGGYSRGSSGSGFGGFGGGLSGGGGFSGRW